MLPIETQDGDTLDIVASTDDDLGDGRGCLRDYVATGLISREKVETAGSQLAFEATFEAANTSPGTARSTTVRISEAVYNELGSLGVP